MNTIPTLPRNLGLAGLVPQLACLAALIAGPDEWRFAALAIAWGYAALIFSFLGGLWWGIAATQLHSAQRVPDWLWLHRRVVRSDVPFQADSCHEFENFCREPVGPLAHLDIRMMSESRFLRNAQPD